MNNISPAPDPIKQKLRQLHELCEEYPEYIPVPRVAKFLGAKPDGIRSSIDRGQCPFGIGWKLGAQPAYKIPTVKFFLWYTNSGVTIPWGEGA